jgi:hypothetical protein
MVADARGVCDGTAARDQSPLVAVNRLGECLRATIATTATRESAGFIYGLVKVEDVLATACSASSATPGRVRSQFEPLPSATLTTQRPGPLQRRYSSVKPEPTESGACGFFWIGRARRRARVSRIEDRGRRGIA